MTIRLGPWLAMGLWMTATGCVVGKSSLGETSPGDEGEGSGDAASSESGSEGGTSGLGGTSNPGHTTVEPGSESGTGDDVGGGGWNAACSGPAPSPLPALPEINLLPSGAPAFTAWEPLTADCDALVPQVQTCVGGCPGSDVCIGNGEGVCALGDIDIWCDGEGEVTGFSEGCFVCLSAAQHARGCCEVPEAFDCRIWPFAGTSGRDMICATHEDCEPGLVCASPHDTPTGYGICRCPEDVGTNVDLDGCFDYD